jgi:hypothetical protein
LRVSVVKFADTSLTFFGKKNVKWNFGDGTTSTKHDLIQEDDDYTISLSAGAFYEME